MSVLQLKELNGADNLVLLEADALTFEPPDENAAQVTLNCTL